MKSLRILLLLFILTITAVASQAQNLQQNKGIGVILGEPTGISLGYWVSEARSFAAGTAWSFEGNENLHIHLDYLFHQFPIVDVERGSLPLYFGLGGRLRFGDNETLGVRFPLGAAYHLEDHPIEFFLEVVPILGLVPDTRFTGNSGLGMRFYF